MRSRILSRARNACLAGALALGCGVSASAVSITNLSVVLDTGNSATLFDDVAPVYREIRSSVGVLSSSATGFTTRYAAGVFTDAGTNGAATTSITLNASYTISFDVIDALGSNWRLDLTTNRVGARTSENDNVLLTSASAFSLSSVVGVRTGVGTLTAGSLGLAAIANSQQTGTVDLAFNQNGTGSISGTGNGTVTLNFTFNATAQTIVTGAGANAQGDEAAIRMGIGDTLPSYTAGEYPGAGTRTPANDGHFVDLDVFDLGPIPEPDTALLLGSGLAWLAYAGRRNRR